MVTIGLALSCLLDTLCVGLASGRVWEKPFINLIRLENASRIQTSARYLSRTANLSSHEEWIKSLGDIELDKCDLNPEDKLISLSDDHGKDKLMVLARKLVRSIYVKSVLCSLPFDKSGRSFIRKVYPDGRIAITLLRYDAGYSLMVETTGKNTRETKNIADILKEKFES